MLTFLAWPAAVVTGLSLGLLGSGGSIIIIPVLLYLCGLGEKEAIGSALLIVGCISSIGAIAYIRKKLVYWDALLWFGLPGMAGTYVGAWLATWMSGLLQLSLFALIMLIASIFMLRKPALPQQSTDTLQPKRPWYQLILGGFSVGIITGTVGVGGGFLIVPALLFLARFKMQNAVATSMVIITCNALTGFYKYTEVFHQHGLHFNWTLITIITILGIIGSLFGSKLAMKIPQQKLRQIFGIFLIVMGAYMLIRSILQMHLLG
ncbi:sulfite exporter TauE/SafE family protein [Celerinatantimonas diazotrophica]|uniref:Probable membrane transporter protein n=1 Tax=Celerinatantimonas diazotrophica TaxID=412034 RepID=A0A4R1JA86_9GAMM|nr:sulfite exporter TauE/SafE family protein [Celerinatantimonas diazotrophica]TCK47440.1 hypothetical protein EV690_2464 [Celerinatantimonas diazotrophica]CAG9294941.1 hypothetical protein CEDIAZO_00047 [Celerinatantimonas diazotrophica]